MIHTPKNLEHLFMLGQISIVNPPWYNLLLDISSNLTKMSECQKQKNQH